MGSCHCRGGPTCCLLIAPVSQPFKCPECGIWWFGYEHRCRKDIRIDINTTSNLTSVREFIDSISGAKNDDDSDQVESR